MNVIQRGQAAEELMRHPLLVETLELVERAIIEQWADTTDNNLREELYYTLQGQRRFKTVLDAAIQNGKLEAHLGESNE